MGGAKLLKWRLAAEGAKLLKSGAVLILSIPGWFVWSKRDASQLGGVPDFGEIINNSV